MQITTYQENGKWGYIFGNGPVIHSQGGFSSLGLAEVAGRQEQAETLAYAHRFEPRATVMFDPKNGSRYVTGWVYKCACGQVRITSDTHGNALLIRDDAGPCLAATRVKACVA